MKLRTLHTVVFGGASYAPDSIIEIDEREAARLIRLGAAKPAEKGPEPARKRKRD